MKTILTTLLISFVLTSSAQTPSCNSIPAGTDFGVCQMVLGIAHIENQGCVTLSGCGYTAADGVDYSTYFYFSPELCEAACIDACPEIPLTADFGECDMALGVAKLENGQCTFLSGCGYTANDGVDYSSYFFDSIEECDAACFGAEECIDPTLINPTAICPVIWAPVCGCNNVTYSNDCEATNLGGVTSWTQGECALNVDEIETTFIEVFPNPTMDEIKITATANVKLTHYQIYSQDGRLVMQGGYAGSIDVTSLAKGTYVLKAGSDKKALPYSTIFFKN